MTPLLVLTFAATCLAQNSATDLTKTGTGTDPNDPDKKFFQLPFVNADQSNSLWGGALGAGAALLGQQVLNGVLGGGNGCGRKRRQAQDPKDPDTKFLNLGGLFGGNSNNNCNPQYQQQSNPCGRKRRQANGVTDTGEKVDTKFFGLFGNSGGNNCGNYQQPQYQQLQYQQPQYQQPQYQQPQYQQPQYQQPQYQQPQNQQPQNQFNSVCQCSSYSKLDNYNNEEARCAKADHTGRAWCYSTTNSQCADAQSSKKYPRNPWSYQACGNNGR